MEQQQQQPTSTSENSVTFSVDKVELSTELPSLMSAQTVLKSQGIKVDDSEDFSHRGDSEEKFVFARIPGIMAAIHTAYGNHYALKLSVSDFIILIGQGLSRHLEKNVKELREYFVNHEGKEMIRIDRNGFVKGEQNDWSTVFGEFAEEIKKRVKTDIHDVIIDDTSVATPVTRIVSEITLMDAMKGYFDYRVRTCCGIPQITLEGTPEDWKKFQDKMKKLEEMNQDDCLYLGWWLENLKPLVEKICEAGIERKIDAKFWSEIYKYDGGSGGPYITGWITTFFPYLGKTMMKNSFENDRLTSGDIPKQTSQVSFIWEYYGEEIHMSFYGGFMGAEFDKETFTVKPAHFWSVNYDK